MATRFYLPSTGAADVTPASFNASWNKTSEADNLKCVTTTIGSTMASPTRTANGVSSTDTCVRRYVSAALPAGLISGTVKGQILCLENAAANNFCPQIVIAVVSNDGTTVTGTLVAADTSALSNEWQTVLTNSKFPRNWSGAGVTVSNVTANLNDRIVLEIGYRQTSTNATAQTPMQFGDNGGSDLPEDETTTTATLNPWIEFSQSLFSGVAGGHPPFNPIPFQAQGRNL